MRVLPGKSVVNHQDVSRAGAGEISSVPRETCKGGGEEPKSAPICQRVPSRGGRRRERSRSGERGPGPPTSAREERSKPLGCVLPVWNREKVFHRCSMFGRMSSRGSQESVPRPYGWRGGKNSSQGKGRMLLLSVCALRI